MTKKKLQTLFTPAEWRVLARLTTPAKIQDFVNRLPMNFERGGETCKSPRMVLKDRAAHCFEAALLSAVALRAHGRPPLVVDLLSDDTDDDHVIAVFKERGLWGAVSKSNHVTLRYREPVYRTIRELVMSYFHEYFTQKRGRKTLRRYSAPMDLSRFDRRGWMTAEEDVWFLSHALDRVPHTEILSRGHIKRLRPVDVIEIQAGKLLEWQQGHR